MHLANVFIKLDRRNLRKNTSSARNRGLPEGESAQVESGAVEGGGAGGGEVQGKCEDRRCSLRSWVQILNLSVTQTTSVTYPLRLIHY